MLVQGLWIAIVAALLSGCPDVLLKVADDDDYYGDDELYITTIDDIEEDEEAEITVEVTIDDQIEDDKTAEITLSIECDGSNVSVSPKRRKARNSRARWTNIDLDRYRAADDENVYCTVTAEAEIDGEQELTTEEFTIIGSVINARVNGSRLSFDNTDDEGFVTLVREKNTSLSCKASLVVWPSNDDSPTLVINGEDGGLAGVRIDRGRVDGLHLTGDARRCQLQIGNVPVEIPDDYEQDDDIIKRVEVYSSRRLRIFHSSNSGRTIDIAVYEGNNKIVSTTRTLSSSRTDTVLTISNVYFERNVDYTVWIKYYNRVIMFPDVDGSW